MHIHILGVCGTFMTGLASMAKSLGHKVTGSDINFYPPMSEQLNKLGIKVYEDYNSSQLQDKPDQVIVGNVMTRGHEVIETLLEKNIPFTSGPQWLYENVLRERYVIAVSGTHGKTTTSSMLSWILDDNELNPSYLIGGVPKNFKASSRLTESKFFVIEADEYDSAFFDKRPKFIHYHPKINIINNLEFDHIDIYKDLDEILCQFHQLIRIMPRNGKLIINGDDKNIQELIKRGYWSEIESFGYQDKCDWRAKLEKKNNLEVSYKSSCNLKKEWKLDGEYNIENALGAIAAANMIGISPEDSLQSLTKFSGVKRRFDLVGNFSDIIIYDDFAHHPTSINKTIRDIIKLYPNNNISVSIEMRSNTMKSGVHNQRLLQELSDLNLDFINFLSNKEVGKKIEENILFVNKLMRVFHDPDELALSIDSKLSKGSVHVFLSNGDFLGAKEKLLTYLS
jgi:UDP-N-acetylmuramate: L-alanyl-gamma-D-glutamyl-meso-diaminopimelate ligase